MFPRFSGRATTSMFRFGHHRRYSPERNWEPLSDTEWAVLSYGFRAAEAEAEKRCEAALTAARQPTRRPSASAAP
jgi:hypothetical protein